jgi:hypothetical protein
MLLFQSLKLMKLHKVGMLTKAFSIGSVAGIAIGSGISLVMPGNEHYTSFTFDQNVGLSSNLQESTKFQIGNKTFTAYKVDETQLAKILAPKADVIKSLGEMDTSIIARSNIKELEEKIELDNQTH